MLKIGDKIKIEAVVIAKKETAEGEFLECCLPANEKDKIHWNTIEIIEQNLIPPCKHLENKTGLMAGKTTLTYCSRYITLVDSAVSCPNCEERE